MPETGTLSDLLAAQSERKLGKMREGIEAEINRLGMELRLVEEALTRKRRAKQRAATSDDAARKVEPATRVVQVRTERNGSGHFDGLPRQVLLAHIAEMGRPVRPHEVQKYLLTKGISRKVEAVRVGMNRLWRADELSRQSDGAYVVASGNGHSPRLEAEAPIPPGTLGFDS